MLEALQQLGFGFSLALQPTNLMYALIGATLGTSIGVLPGLGPATTIAILLPITYQIGDPLGAVIMLASIYYGAMYGGSTTSILMRIPGEAASVVTCIDGYAMARQGRAGPALAIAAIGSFIAGTIAVVALTLVGPLFAQVAVRFGPPEMFGLAVLGLVLCASLSGGPPLRGFVMVLAGLLLGLVGVDTLTGTPRFTFGSFELTAGIELVPLLMGLFGVGEILHTLERKGAFEIVATRIGRLLPTREDWQRSRGPIARGTVLGFVTGLIPGGGAIIGSMASYAVEKRLSKEPESFGKGNIAGVAGPEAANNAAASASFVPLLSLGLPGNAVTAVLFAGLLIQNVQPGPLMLKQHADVFWGVIASMYVGNVMLLILNLPLVGLWLQLLRVPFWILGPTMIVVASFGAYSLRNNPFDVMVLMVAGAAGYLFRKGGLDAAPLAMAFILADILDTALRQSLLIGDGRPAIFLERPISATLIAIAAVFVAAQVASRLIRARQRGEGRP